MLLIIKIPITACTFAILGGLINLLPIFILFMPNEVWAYKIGNLDTHEQIILKWALK
jgi:hypothetical protein